MRPPSDPPSHPNQKFILLLQELQRQRRGSGPARPLHALMPTRAANIRTATQPSFIPRAQDTNINIDVDDDDECCACEDSASTDAPITIQIDASISIIGDRNVITIPPVNTAESSGNNPSPQTAGEKRSDNKHSNNHNTSAAQAFNHLHAFQRTRYGFFAGLINDALRDARPRLNNNNESRATDNLVQMVQLDVDAGIRVRGSGNVVCAAPRVRTSSDDKQQMLREGLLGSRKRASSVR